MPNRLDQISKLLTEQLREIDKEIRELERAKSRIVRMQKELNHTPKRATPEPRNYKSQEIVLDHLSNGTQEEPFTIQKTATQLSHVLRENQVKGAFQTLTKNGTLKRIARGAYEWNRE